MNESDYLSEDYDPYDNTQQRSPASRPSTNWTLIIGILAGIGFLCVLLCCGGIYYLFSFGTDVMTQQVRDEIEDNQVIQQHIGTISVMEIDLSKIATVEKEQEGALVFRIEGDKGSGYLTVEASAGFVADGTLKLDSGELFPLFDDEPPADEGVDDAADESRPVEQQEEGAEE